MTLKNTDKSYRIIVRNTQTADGETDVIEEIAYGSYQEKNGKQYLMYKIVTDEGETVSVTMIADGSCMTIKRRGMTDSTIVYRAGKRYGFPYRTPFGTIDMEIETDRLISDLSYEGGKIELRYTLTVQGEKYRNDMKITVNKRL